ncbi:hypothetical protein [Carboxylicivirga caseinilyticus]|uniref:hypothetical protein n=1 Tax=Carboxylicivirga caseinilyticus TaxID=3417572 RepID=UPI003D3436A9|nr:hypothetical protein [Marinilabiliaceae bacterium A049]
MKKLILTLILNLFLFTISFAQIPEEAFPLTNSLSKLWYSGQIEKAVENSIELQKIYSPFFVDRIHNSFSQFLKTDTTGNGINYLEMLSSKNNEEVNKIISGIYLWGKILNSSNQDEYREILAELHLLLKEIIIIQRIVGIAF